MILWTQPVQLAFWTRVNLIFERCWKWVYAEKISPLQKPEPAISKAAEVPQDMDGFMLFYVHPVTGKMTRIGYNSGKYDA